MRIIPLAGLTLLLSVSSFAQSAYNQFIGSTSGSKKMRITQRELVLSKLLYLERDLNNLYGKFLDYDDYRVPDDGRVDIFQDNRNNNGLVLIFSMTQKVYHSDPQFSLHKRIANMMFRRVRSQLSPDEKKWVHFSAAVDTLYNAEKMSRSNPRRWLSVLSLRMQYILPEPDEETHREQTRKGSEQVRLTALEYAQARYEPALNDFKQMYKPYLDLNGLQWPRDAYMNFMTRPNLKTTLFLVFHLNSRSTFADQNLSYHQSFANTLDKFLNQEIELRKPRWLNFSIVADTTGTGQLKRPIVLN